MPRRRNTSAPKKKTRKRGRGQPKFVPTQEQRDLVKIAIGTGISQDEVVLGIKNPYSGKPIDRNTFAKAFAEEIAIARFEVRTIVGVSLVKQAKSGNLGACIWLDKTRFGMYEAQPPVQPSKVDPAGTDVKHFIEIEGGLPTGSTAANPEGTQPVEGAQAEESAGAPSTEPPSETI